MAHPILERLAAGEILLCDGGMGTELQFTAGDFACPEELNMRHPDAVAAAHRAYFDAGSDIVETNTFGGTRARLKMHGLGDHVREISFEGAQIARSVCPEGRFVFGSIGPTGEMLEPFGDAEPRALYDMFTEQADALAKGGVDAIIVETMMDAEEARLAVEAAKTHTSLPVIATMTFAVRDGSARTRWGVDVPTAVDVLTEAGADVVGSNCGDGFDEMIVVIGEMRGLTGLPVIAQANAGVPVMVDDEPVYRETPEDILPKASRLLELGVNILGGCCGTRPDHIAAMRALIGSR
jgi:5-methyltetrahydrofolate--homocysteine methyltransferase